MSSARGSSDQEDPGGRPRGWPGAFMGFSGRLAADSDEVIDAGNVEMADAQVWSLPAPDVAMIAAQLSPVTPPDADDRARAVAMVEHSQLVKQIEDHRMVVAAYELQKSANEQNVCPRLTKHIEDCTIALSAAEAHPDQDYAKTVVWLREFVECAQAHWCNLRSGAEDIWDDVRFPRMAEFAQHLHDCPSPSSTQQGQFKPPPSPEILNPDTMFEEAAAHGEDTGDTNDGIARLARFPKQNAASSKPRPSAKKRASPKPKPQARAASPKPKPQAKKRARKARS